MEKLLCCTFFTFCFACGTIYCLHDHQHNQQMHSTSIHAIFEKIFQHAGVKNESKDGRLLMSFNDFIKCVELLNLRKCDNEINNGTTKNCNTCFNAEDIFNFHNISTSHLIDVETFRKKISVSVLYMLAMKRKTTSNMISRQSGVVCKRLDSTMRINTNDRSINILQSLQNEYTAVESQSVFNEDSLFHLLKDINTTVGEYQNVKQCFSIHDVITATGISEKYIDQHDLEYVAGFIILQLLDKKCISVDDHDLPEPHYFIDVLFSRFGNLTHMASEKFEVLYNELNLGKKQQVEHDHEEHDGGRNNVHDHGHGEHDEDKRRRRSTSTDKCFSASQILEIFSVPHDSFLDENKFKEVCPALIRQLQGDACVKKPHKDKKMAVMESETWKPWIGMFVAITVISISSLSGIFAAPLSNRKWFPYFIMSLISLAVAVLIGDAMMHLFPHAVGLHQHKPEGEHDKHAHEEGNPMLKADSFLWKSLMFLVGVYIFFLFEILMHAFGGGHSHSHGMEEHVTSSSTNNSMKVKGTLSMSESSMVYNLTGTDSRIVTRPSGLHECASESSCDEGDDDGETVETDMISTPNLVMSDSSSNQGLMKKGLIEPNQKSRSNTLTSQYNNTVSLKEFQSVAWMVLIGDGIHNFLDGIAIGVAFSETWPDGLHGGVSTSIAIFCHELPHELGDFAVLLNSGLSIKQALLMNFISSLTAYIGGIIGVSLGTQWAASPWIFTLTAGLFVYIALVDMLPEVLHSAILKLRPWFCITIASIGLWTGFCIMFVLGAWEDDIKSAFG